MRCGNPAKHTQRLVESEDLIVVGAAGMYEARCRRCFEPGVPKQELLEFARPAARPDAKIVADKKLTSSLEEARSRE
jgi:thymidine kinase